MAEKRGTRVAFACYKPCLWDLCLLEGPSSKPLLPLQGEGAVAVTDIQKVVLGKDRGSSL